jgi:hypothetical protein
MYVLFIYLILHLFFLSLFTYLSSELKFFRTDVILNKNLSRLNESDLEKLTTVSTVMIDVALGSVQNAANDANEQVATMRQRHIDVTVKR